VNDPIRIERSDQGWRATMPPGCDNSATIEGPHLDDVWCLAEIVAARWGLRVGVADETPAEPEPPLPPAPSRDLASPYAHLRNCLLAGTEPVLDDWLTAEVADRELTRLREQEVSYAEQCADLYRTDRDFSWKDREAEHRLRSAAAEAMRQRILSRCDDTTPHRTEAPSCT